MIPLTFLLVVLLIILALYLWISNVQRPAKYPPGPLFLPVLGSIYAVPGQGAHFELEKWRKKYGNIIGHKYGSNYEVYITGVEESLAAMKHPNFQGRKIFQHRNSGLKRGLFFNDGPAWAILKRFTLQYFSEYQQNKLDSLVADEMNEVFNNILLNEVVNIDYKFAPITLNVLMIIIGSFTKEKRTDFFDKILSHTYKSLHETRPTGIENHIPIIRKLFMKKDKDVYKVHKFLRECISKHRSSLDIHNPRDYIDAFLIEQQRRIDENEDNNIFTDDELVSDSYDLIRAGTISTGDTISLVLLYLTLYPKFQEKLQNEIDEKVDRDRIPTVDDKKNLPYCEAVIAESLRINPIVPFTAPHRATADTEFYGYSIPKDTTVKVSLWTLMKDSEIWKNPDEFNPDRFVENGEFIMHPTHQPFGIGKRSCLMKVMAWNIVFLFIASFCQKYKVIQPPNYPPPSTEMIQGSVAGPKPFYVIIEKR